MSLRRIAGLSVISTIISITLVLFVTGLLGFVLISGHMISTQVRESLTVEIFLKDDMPELSRQSLEASIGAMESVKSVKYISKDEARAEYIRQTGDDFTEILDANPLLASLQVNFTSEYANEKYMSRLEADVQRSHGDYIFETTRKKELIQSLDNKLEKIALILAVIGALLLLIVVTLINNTVRLSIFSRRFLIKTMQLVGATSGFIMRPFLLNGLLKGLVAGLLADAMLLLFVGQISKLFPDFFISIPAEHIIILLTFVASLGILIPTISTLLVVSKFLRKSITDIHQYGI